MATPGRTIDRTYDTNLQLADTQTVTAATIGTVTGLQVSSAAKILDLGAARFAGDGVFDIGAVTATAGIASMIAVQGSNSSTFASGNVNLATMPIGDVTIIGESADDAGSGRYILPFETVKKGTTYRYVRAAVIAMSATQSCVVTQAFVAKRD
jgi:hypothetical protein